MEYNTIIFAFVKTYRNYIANHVMMLQMYFSDLFNLKNDNFKYF